MKLDQKMVTALTNQVQLEEFSSRVYLALYGWCSTAGYNDAATYYLSRSNEELKHRDKFINFLLDCEVPIRLLAVQAPTVDNITVLEDTVLAAFNHEQRVTKSIFALDELAEELNDCNTDEFLHWFIAEQREEEKTYSTILAWCKTAGLTAKDTPEYAKRLLRLELEELLEV